jgi:hypothetical protein
VGITWPGQEERPPWADHFRIQSEVELDFVIGQQAGWPVGMPRRSPPEFKRRILAAATSYLLQLNSIDYAKRRYVEKNQYEEEPTLLGEEVSAYLSGAIEKTIQQLYDLHTVGELGFGVFGSEITLYRVPYAIDMARMMANRGLLLEVLPILRLCLEMTAWARVAFFITDESKVVSLKAQSCISQLKDVYKTAGKIYGYLSEFTHWGHVIHRYFISLDGEKTSVLYASARYRAMSLALCLVLLDVLVEVSRFLYGEKCLPLVDAVQGCELHDSNRKIFKLVSSIAEKTGLEDLLEIQLLLT